MRFLSKCVVVAGLAATLGISTVGVASAATVGDNPGGNPSSYPGQPSSGPGQTYDNQHGNQNNNYHTTDCIFPWATGGRGNDQLGPQTKFNFNPCQPGNCYGLPNGYSSFGQYGQNYGDNNGRGSKCDPGGPVRESCNVLVTDNHGWLSTVSILTVGEKLKLNSNGRTYTVVSTRPLAFRPHLPVRNGQTLDLTCTAPKVGSGQGNGHGYQYH